MEAKGIESMTKEELIEFATSLNKELLKAKEEARKYERWWEGANERIQAAKLFMKVL